MKNHLIYYMSALILIFAAGCSNLEDAAPTADQKALEQLDQASAPDQNLQAKGSENLRVQKLTGKGLNNLQVVGELQVVEDLDYAGNFAGKVSITELTYDQVKGGLLASGEIIGIATSEDGKKTHVKQTFTEIPTTLADENIATANARVAAECQILFLDLGPIFLDVLGLQVDLSQIILDVTAVSGSGNLLGNLLCAVAGLLDPVSGLLDLIANIGDLLDLLGDINDILGSL